MQTPSTNHSLGNSPSDRNVTSENQKVVNSQGYNTFNLDKTIPDTQNAASIELADTMTCIPGDRIRYNSRNLIKANALVAPLMSEISMYLDFYLVPKSCIYPINWDKIITNPTKGDDLPQRALPSLPIGLIINKYLLNAGHASLSDNFLGVQINDEVFTLDSGVLNNNTTLIVGNLDDSDSVFSTWLRFNYLLRALMLLSSDSLLHRCGYCIDFNYLITTNDDTNSIFSGDSYRENQRVNLQEIIKAFFDYLYDFVTTNILSSSDSYVGFYSFTEALPSFITYRTSSFGAYSTNAVNLRTLSEFRHFMYRSLEDSHIFYFEPDDTINMREFFTTCESVLRILRPLANLLNTNPTDISTAPLSFIDASPLIAYQMSCAQYQSIDSVDYIYSSKLWMQNFRSCMSTPSAFFIPASSGSNSSSITSTSNPTFEYNGVITEYDVFTDGYFRYYLNNQTLTVPRMLSLFSNLFCKHRSLRFRDYVGSALPNVIAVGDTQIAVNNQYVQSEDVTKSLIKRIYLNAVNRVGSKPVNYLAGIFGVAPINVEQEPHYIARSKYNIGRTFNTDSGDTLGEQNTNLESTSDSVNFDIYVDEHSELVVLRSFDCMFTRTSGVSRHLTNLDRFQNYNPMMQKVGDQPLFTYEVDGKVQSSPATFGYSTRYSEYKNPWSVAHGGSLLYLPGWFALRKDPQPFEYDVLSRNGAISISPNYIRHLQTEYDIFYKQLTSLDPSGYFHFVISHTPAIKTARKIDFFPGLLWH